MRSQHKRVKRQSEITMSGVIKYEAIWMLSRDPGKITTSYWRQNAPSLPQIHYRPICGGNPAV